MEKPYSALITGGASGIGKALAQHLVKKGWKVTIADISEANGKATAEMLGPDVSFVQTDVSKFDQQVAMFNHAFAFGGDQLDFFCASAAITDTQDFYEDMPLDSNGNPTPLNLHAVEVDLTAIIQGTWLYKYYASKNSTRKGGKMVMMSSVGGLYASPMQPMYGLSKHALVGLARSLGSPFLVNENVTVNAICPSMILTPLCPPEVAKLMPEEHLTPMSTALRAFDKILDDGAMTGKVLELANDQIFERQQIPFANETVEWGVTKGVDLAKVTYGDFYRKDRK